MTIGKDHGTLNSILRALIITEAILGVGGSVVDPVFSNLPQALQEYQASQQGSTYAVRGREHVCCLCWSHNRLDRFMAS